MIEIIQEGNINNLKKWVKFNCPFCECVFLADNDDFIYTRSIDDEYDEYRSVCPTCNRIVYSINPYIQYRHSGGTAQ